MVPKITKLLVTLLRLISVAVVGTEIRMQQADENVGDEECCILWLLAKISHLNLQPKCNAVKENIISYAHSQHNLQYHISDLNRV